jgi:hypothetical protein
MRRIDSMALYLRYTETPAADVERNTSYHDLGFYQGEDAEIDVEHEGKSDVAVLDGRFAQIIGGLCGYALESDTVREAIEEVKQNPLRFPYMSPESSTWAIYEGRDPHINNVFGDGDIFRAVRLLHVELL